MYNVKGQCGVRFRDSARSGCQRPPPSSGLTWAISWRCVRCCTASKLTWTTKHFGKIPCRHGHVVTMLFLRHGQTYFPAKKFADRFVSNLPITRWTFCGRWAPRSCARRRRPASIRQSPTWAWPGAWRTRSPTRISWTSTVTLATPWRTMTQPPRRSGSSVTVCWRLVCVLLTLEEVVSTCCSLFCT